MWKRSAPTDWAMRMPSPVFLPGPHNVGRSAPKQSIFNLESSANPPEVKMTRALPGFRGPVGRGAANSCDRTVVVDDEFVRSRVVVDGNSQLHEIGVEYLPKRGARGGTPAVPP